MDQASYVEFARKSPVWYWKPVNVGNIATAVLYWTFLFACKLMATGTLSGLVFYANIFGVNFITFVSYCLILEDWIRTTKQAWLQFVDNFGRTDVIFVSHYSLRSARLLGNIPVSVLATLILLSYTRLILSIFIAAIFISEYPTFKRIVWLYDTILPTAKHHYNHVSARQSGYIYAWTSIPDEKFPVEN